MQARLKPVKRRVAITGVGAISALGPTLAATWEGIRSGRSRGAPISSFDASEFPSRVAYQVADFALPAGIVSPKEQQHLGLSGQFGVVAAHAALRDAGLLAATPGVPEAAGRGIDPRRFAVCLGVGLSSTDPAWYDDIFIPQKFADPSLKDLIRFFPDQLATVLARLAGAKGGLSTIHTACASSGQSLGEAYEMVAYGEADCVLTGGADSMINPFFIAGFSLLGALSQRNDEPAAASRPFDRAREGFVMGEGAAMLVFEDWAQATARGARILGEVCGYGVTESAYRITDLHPEGIGPIEAMQMALDDAGLPAAAVGYLNAHGTSTQLNDRIEALAISRVFGVGPERPFVSSTKSMTGHMVAAAGAIEAAICLQAVREQLLPPSVNIFEKDPECPIELTPAVAAPASLRYAMSNSIGFGGSNTALIIGRSEA